MGEYNDYKLKTTEDLRAYIRRGDPLVVEDQLFTVCKQKNPDTDSYIYDFTASSLPLDRSWRGLIRPLEATTVYIPSWVCTGDNVWIGGQGGVQGKLHPITKEWIEYKRPQPFETKTSVKDVYKHEVTNKVPLPLPTLSKTNDYSVSSNPLTKQGPPQPEPAHFDKLKPLSVEEENRQRKLRSQKAYMHQREEAIRTHSYIPKPPPPSSPSPQELKRQQEAEKVYNSKQSTIFKHNNIPTTNNVGLYNTEMMLPSPDSEIKHHGGTSLTNLQEQYEPKKNETVLPEAFTALNTAQFASYNNSTINNDISTTNNNYTQSTEDTQTTLSNALWERMRSNALRKIDIP